MASLRRTFDTVLLAVVCVIVLGGPFIESLPLLLSVEDGMRRDVSALVLSTLLLSCQAHPTASRRPLRSSISLAQGTGDGAASLQVVEAGAKLSLPTGVCTFRLDPDEPTTFATGSEDPARSVKLSGRPGELIVEPVGGKRWSGRGQLTVHWPDYADSETLELRMESVGSRDVDATQVACKYQIAQGVGVEWYVNAQ